MPYTFAAGTDLLSMITSLPNSQCVTFRFHCTSGVNTPNGDNVDVDLWITVMKTDDANWHRVIARDVRSTCVWEINSYDSNGSLAWTYWRWVTGTGANKWAGISPYNYFPFDSNINALCKNGNVVTTTFHCLYDGTYNIQDAIIGTIPVEMRPSVDCYINVKNYDSNSITFLVKIGTDCNISIMGIGSSPISVSKLDFFVSATWMSPNA